MKKKRMKAELKELIHFLKSLSGCQNEEMLQPSSESVLDDEEGLEKGSSLKLETSPSSSLIRSWQFWGDQDEDSQD